MPYPTDNPATWFVTGASRGLGAELVRQLLRRGDNVAATTRSAERLSAALAGVDTGRLLPLVVDLTDAAAVDGAVAAALDRFGRLDVVVNNAGYGFLGAVEETTDAEIRQMLDVQVSGVWNVLRSAVPHLRAARSGHIINVSSILGLTAVPGWGLYCAGKFALNGMSEALAAELAEFGIRVTIVEPGYFRTDFLTTESLALPTAAGDAYPAIREMTEQHLQLQGSQLGDPVKGAAAVIDIAVTGGGPLHQLLGSDAVSYAEAKIDALVADVKAGRDLALTTDHR
ncbi:SDR family NAD(P)-dependent oxidoreductase [Mycolicibacterium austroafricanum]|uniref:SDR family NAD(P)-dependent oxidoreductase n=1 Tax=Mycolicibacterium austroafricanum TaxID=39687 RepID=UPI000CF84219|nr:SDR family NAD(P)-dependent oxidoreductase [Mycolicibacterium austroafricanum]PQP51639.1 short-chain dehydrogenase/reductase [Mycolicibacterium austroafricanum]QRZ06541.1 SDR family NAD(P)-dependent oxidoreductase [Mycolicibacterium austroafricanum]QZT68025.1 SDR family NAD(P)-dependent oxidoreductase [Mycolicibacterium austroafricanum]